jgi:hypothetical protein
VAIKLKTFPAVTVTNAGQRKPLSETSVLVYAVSVQSLRTNTGYQYLGDSTVTSSNGYEFGPSDVSELEPPPGTAGREPGQLDLKDIYVDSSTDAAEFRIVGCIRD